MVTTILSKKNLENKTISLTVLELCSLEHNLQILLRSKQESLQGSTNIVDKKSLKNILNFVSKLTEEIDLENSSIFDSPNKSIEKFDEEIIDASCFTQIERDGESI